MVCCYRRSKRGRRDKLMRNAKGYRIGQDHHNAKLTDEDVEMIRLLYDEGVKAPEIARKFETSVNTIYGIIKFRSRTGVMDL